MKKSLTGIQIWQIPVMLGAIIAGGLIAALLSDGAGDIVSWISLAVPVAVVVWHASRRA